VAPGSVVIPPFSEGLFIGKIKGNYGVDIPGELLIEPLGLGTPGAYMARVVTRVLTSEEVEKLRGRKEDCINKDNEETGVIPSTTNCHEIRTGDALPIKKNSY
jgi:hypothetical protein